ncbi:MAG: LysR family transcriptional regulator [Rhodoferax sp.]|nr:LysR family transcriptional regulator [Rhodoferax sp.]
MDLKQLEYFVRVAELGSFTRASSVLDIAQPALSRQVRLLEVELRQNLLLRNGRGVTTTEAGKLLLEHGRGILHQVERAREDLGRVRGALAGRVALGLPPSIAKMMTVPLTREFRKRLPNAALSISEGLSISMQEGLLTGRLDIALLYNPSPSPELETRPLMEEELYLIALRPPKSSKARVLPIPLKEVSGLPLVIPSRPNAIRMLVETQMAGIGCKPLISLEIDGVAAILDLVADGAGNAILPRYALASTARPENYLAHPIVKPRLVSKLALATASGRTTTLTQQAMLDLIQEVAMAVFGSASPKA